jgi:endonuclease/exonuclease/phosphatase family metal-dependent hydrolase
MKRAITVLLFLVSLSSFLQGQEKDTFRIISYNIWNGFDWGKDTARAQAFQEWMRSVDCDVAAFQELCGYNDRRLQEEAAQWGHPHTVLLKKTGYSVGLSSRYPIELLEKIRDGLHHGALHCRTRGLDFLVVHLHPGSVERRREEMGILLKKIGEIMHNTDKLIVLGDFNAHSPYDAHLYEPKGALLSHLRKNNKEKPGLTGNLAYNDLDYSVMSGFLSIPLCDAVRPFTNSMEERGSFPAMALGRVNEETTIQLESRMERIDYIMVSEPLLPACVDARVLNGKENWYLSDHYPVLADFIIE